MKFKDKIGDELRSAMKARDTGAVAGLRMIIAAMKNREIEKRGELDDDECIKILSTLVKQRNESIDMYRKGGRDDLVSRELAELALIKSFLPEQLSEDELSKMIDDAIAECGAFSPGDMGKVMKIVSPKTRGRADGKVVSELVKKKLQ